MHPLALMVFRRNTCRRTAAVENEHAHAHRRGDLRNLE
jgi:hypothetical protein